MENRDVKVSELPLPEQPLEGYSSAPNSQETATAVIPSDTTAKSPLGVLADKGRDVVAATRRGKTTPARIVSSLTPQGNPPERRQPQVLSEWESSSVARLRKEFLHICLPLFFAEENPLRCLGITSSVAGEGKTSAAWLVSYALATGSSQSVVLVECDWERPSFSRDLGLPPSPGLAEYLSGTSNLSEIRYQFLPNLTIIPAGMGGADSVTALAQLRWLELYERLTNPDELMILDLPSVLGSSYGVIAARLAESLMMVVRAGGTPAPFVTRACNELQRLRVYGIVLNKVQTSIPRWLQAML